jgi:hypothetical protein
MAERNPPAHADLDKAWRNSVVVGSLLTASVTFGTAALTAANLLHSRGLCEVCVGGAGAALLGALGVALVARRNFWLSRAIAVVGTRPDIGYEGFARLPGIRRISRTLLAMPVLAVGFCLVNIILGGNGELTKVNAAFDVYLLALAVNCALQYVFQAGARRELARRLAR